MHTKRVPVSCFLGFHVHLWKACIFVVVEGGVIFAYSPHVGSRKGGGGNDFCCCLKIWVHNLFQNGAIELKMLFHSSQSYKQTNQKLNKDEKKKGTKSRHIRLKLTHSCLKCSFRGDRQEFSSFNASYSNNAWTERLQLELD